MNTLIIYSDGEMFPLNWIFGRSSSAGAYFCALSDCEVAIISQTEMRKIMEERVDVTNAMLRQFGEQFAVYATRVGTMSFKYGRERLAHRLLFLAYRFGKKLEGTECTVLPPFSQQDIGASINMARENVNRELANLERQHIITHDGGRIVILDQGALRAKIDMDQELYFDA